MKPQQRSSAARRGALGEPAAGWCAIDFGTSNSGIAIPGESGMRLVAVEGEATTMPTAVFFDAETHRGGDLERYYGRAAISAYVDGLEGRLMRSMKSVLGSPIVEQHTDVGGGRAMRYIDVIADYLRHLKQLAERAGHQPLRRAVIGRPVFFVDDDPARDAKAQRSLEEAARSVGFQQVSFQFEPIAAAFDHERSVTREEIVLVADIGGGTSDFSVVRVGPERMRLVERKDDILANHGVHVAGTDFDRTIELARIMPELGYGSRGPVKEAGVLPREVPSAVYFDLATWHLINTVYQPQRMAELRSLRPFYGDARFHDRLMTVVNNQLGHELAGRAEQAKIETSSGGATRIDLDLVERGLAVTLDSAQAAVALRDQVGSIVECALETVRRAHLTPSQIDTVFFTGGSTGLRALTDGLSSHFPDSQVVRGDPFASVAAGLGLHAERLYGVSTIA